MTLRSLIWKESLIMLKSQRSKSQHCSFLAAFVHFFLFCWPHLQSLSGSHLPPIVQQKKTTWDLEINPTGLKAKYFFSGLGSDYGKDQQRNKSRANVGLHQVDSNLTQTVRYCQYQLANNCHMVVAAYKSVRLFWFSAPWWEKNGCSFVCLFTLLLMKDKWV